MKSDDSETAGALVRTLPLQGGHELSLVRATEQDVLCIRSSSGQTVLVIEVTERGPVLRFEGASLAIEARGELSISAETLRLAGRSGLEVQSQGDIRLDTPGDLHATARVHNIRASLGNVNIGANDDVRLNGERVMVNC
jgi:hypothetical protein